MSEMIEITLDGTIDHPGVSACYMHFPGIDPADLKPVPFGKLHANWPRVVYRRMKQTVHAVRTHGGVTEILSSYAGSGLHTAKKWIEVAA